MRIAKITDIQVGEYRQRREFNPAAISELAASIQRQGVLHPIVCRMCPTTGGLLLVAGERRLRAMQSLVELDIPIRCGETAYLDGTIPVNYINDLSEADAFEAELEENILREDLTWQERAAATAQLHRLRSDQKIQLGVEQTLLATASEIAGVPATSQEARNVKYDLILADHLVDPEVAKAASRKDALKVVEKKAMKAHRALLAETFDLSKTPHELHFADAFSHLATIPSASIDCLCTDPPYGVDANSFGSNFATTHDYADGWEYFLDIAHMLSVEAFRILKPNTHAYVFCSFDGFGVLANAFELAGFKVFKTPLIWSKGNGSSPWINKGHKRTYECIMFAAKGDRDVNIVKSDVLTYSPVAEREHGAEKPVELIADLLGRSTNPGDKIIDPFVGSGTIFPAADVVNCSAIGIERERDSFNLALTRIQTGVEL